MALQPGRAACDRRSAIALVAASRLRHDALQLRARPTMCNRFRMTASRIELLKRFSIDGEAEIDPVSLPPAELFPKRPVWVVRSEAGAARLDVMTWGFPPPATARAPVTNVRNLASPFWRTALATPARRCLVAVTEFCEWEGEPGAKLARWFSVPSQPIFAFAGVWRPTDSGPACAFLTCDPNPLVAAVHPKAMPVILHPDDYARWLTGDFTEARLLAAPFPSQLMAMA
jgi:putative SOS response-associated peptidase YedK